MTVENLSVAPRLILHFGGHIYTFRRVRLPSDPFAAVDIAVIDSDGRQVGGASPVIRSVDGIVERAGSGELHRYGAAVAPGRFTIAVAPPPGYGIASSQPNPFVGVARLDHTTQVTIQLTKR